MWAVLDSMPLSLVCDNNSIFQIGNLFTDFCTSNLITLFCTSNYLTDSYHINWLTDSYHNNYFTYHYYSNFFLHNFFTNNFNTLFFLQDNPFQKTNNNSIVEETNQNSKWNLLLDWVNRILKNGNPCKMKFGLSCNNVMNISIVVCNNNSISVWHEFFATVMVHQIQWRLTFDGQKTVEGHFNPKTPKPQNPKTPCVLII